MPEPVIDQQRFQVIQARVEDDRRLIAAVKIQRWDVLKWAVALNVGLVTAWVALGKQPSLIFTGLGAVVASAAIVLIFHYNKRAAGARTDLDRALALLAPIIKHEELMNRETFMRKGFYGKLRLLFHDGSELVIFTLVLIVTVAVTYFVTGLNR
jgi:hypothetical protein